MCWMYRTLQRRTQPSNRSFIDYAAYGLICCCCCCFDDKPIKPAFGIFPRTIRWVVFACFVIVVWLGRLEKSQAMFLLSAITSHVMNLGALWPRLLSIWCLLQQYDLWACFLFLFFFFFFVSVYLVLQLFLTLQGYSNVLYCTVLYCTLKKNVAAVSDRRAFSRLEEGITFLSFSNNEQKKKVKK